MKLRDLKQIDRDQILAALGLQSRQSTAGWVTGTLGVFGVGLVVGAGLALVFAPKSGRELRQELGTRLRSMREEAGNGRQSLEGA
jgi:hypothetical protein